MFFFHVRRWKRKNDVPVRRRGIIQLLFIFIGKIHVRRETVPHTVPPYFPCSWRQIKEKIIPAHSHQLALQEHTTSCPHARICLQTFLPSSTHSQRPLHWKFVTRYVRYVHKNATFPPPISVVFLGCLHFRLLAFSFQHVLKCHCQDKFSYLRWLWVSKKFWRWFCVPDFFDAVVYSHNHRIFRTPCKKKCSSVAQKVLRSATQARKCSAPCALPLLHCPVSNWNGQEKKNVCYVFFFQIQRLSVELSCLLSCSFFF